MSEASDERIAALERAVAADPAGKAFAALAELYRRAGRLEEAERVVLRGLAGDPTSPEGRAVLALVLADTGRDTDLRRRLEDWAARAVAECAPLAPSPVLLPDADALGDVFAGDEIDRAFEDAEPDRDRMITPDSVAEEAAFWVDGPLALESPLESGGAFATHTMAELLERQGDHEGAARIRARLGRAAPEVAPAAPASGSAATIAVLERWLDNARRMQS